MVNGATRMNMIITFFGIAFAIIVVLLLARQGHGVHAPEAPLAASSMLVRTWIDPETQCQFLILEGKSITPRLNTFGQPMCADTVAVDYE